MTDNVDNEGRDMELASYLRFVDPASSDPNYWLRFQSWVLKSAAPELARRRLMADLTMEDVISGWSRTLVPTAMLAAALAGIFVMRSATSTTAPVAVGVEELLVAGIEGETIPVALDSDEAAGAVAFAGERF